MAEGIKHYRFGDAFSNTTPPTADSPAGSETSDGSLIAALVLDATGSFTGTWAGDWTDSQTGTIEYRRYDNLCLIELPLINAASSTSTGAQTLDVTSMPAACLPKNDVKFYGLVGIVGASKVLGYIEIFPDPTNSWNLTIFPVSGTLNIQQTTIIYEALD